MTGQFSDALRGRLAYNNSWSKTDGLLPAQAGTEPSGTNYAKSTKFPNYSLSGNLDWVASPKLFFGVRGGYYFSDVNDSNVTEEPRIIFATGNTRCTGAAGSSTCPSRKFRAASSSQRDSRRSRRRHSTRRLTISRPALYFQADGTVYASAAGEHQLKFGAQFDRVGNNVLAGESRNRVQPAMEHRAAERRTRTARHLRLL